MLEERFNELEKYLPLDINKGQNMDYIDYHVRAININSDNNLHTISFFAWHILWMSFMEKVCYFIYNYDKVGLLSVLGIGENQKKILADANSPYDLSVINEKTLCNVARYKMIQWHTNKIRNITELVDHRDHIAHCSGVIDRELSDIEHDMDLCLRYTKEIAEKTTTITLAIWDKFSDDMSTMNPEGEREYALVYDAVTNHFSNAYYSAYDILTILKERSYTSADEEDEVIFSKNLAILHVSLLAESYDIDCGIVAEDYVSRMMSMYKKRCEDVMNEVRYHRSLM